ncbi:MAG: hypothetical protein QGH25_22200 [Candidatus Latescibacteria bacterium]|jgi:hypothetical protein|nr:hypothetical protein [Candidatus Latescibacterota bacterium]
MRIARYFAIAFVLALPLSSCELFDCGCAYEMKEIRHRYGHPDQQSTFKSSRGYRAENWRYEPTGGKWRSYTFEWQEYEACDCEVIEETYYARDHAGKPVVRRWRARARGGHCATCP